MSHLLTFCHQKSDIANQLFWVYEYVCHHDEGGDEGCLAFLGGLTYSL